MLEVFKVLLFIIILGGAGTILRYYIIKLSITPIFDGLLIANILGISIAIITFSTLPLFTTVFCGSLTSFSSLIKNSYNYKGNKYLIVHLVIYFTFALVSSNL